MLRLGGFPVCYAPHLIRPSVFPKCAHATGLLYYNSTSRLRRGATLHGLNGTRDLQMCGSIISVRQSGSVCNRIGADLQGACDRRRPDPGRLEWERSCFQESSRRLGPVEVCVTDCFPFVFECALPRNVEWHEVGGSAVPAAPTPAASGLNITAQIGAPDLHPEFGLGPRDPGR